MRSVWAVGALYLLTTWLFARLYQELLSVYEQAGASLTDMEYSWQMVVAALRLHSGHVPGDKFYHMMGIKPSPLCSLYDRTDDVNHWLLECVRNSDLRGRMFGDPGSLYNGLVNCWLSDSLSDNAIKLFFRLLLNLAGYSTVLIPGFMLYKYLKKTNYFDKISAAGTGCLARVLSACFGETNERLPDTTKPLKVDESPAREGAELAFCFTGLMGAYLVWGLLQEKIMTQSYVMSDGSLARFNDSQFLVFINRLLAFGIAFGRLMCARKPLIASPLYKFSYCSLTNIISAWCQYEALKYVSFPTQVLSKSCKVIPVMLMGKLVSRNKYELYEYVTAVLISVGMALFMFGSHDDNAVSTMTTMSGFILLALYMVCDSFTSSWQGALFSQYNCDPMQMLCGVNLFSCVLTAAALIHHTSTMTSIQLLQHPVFAIDCLLLSLSSAIGQLIIYRTIAKFGAVVFTIIMTLRQAVSILLSCIVYGHHISASGGFGVFLVFGAVLLRVYCRQRLRRRRPANI